jgi:hypothetical protein
MINPLPMAVDFARLTCRGVEQLLERISNGRLAEDRRAAMGELREAVSENPTAQMAFGAMGKARLSTGADKTTDCVICGYS